MSSIGSILLSLALLFLFSTFSAAVDITEVEKYKGKEYGPEFFFAITGEVNGQAAPGVKAVLINNQPIKVGQDFKFSTKVFLAEGQKNLKVETQYQGFRFIKNYLVIRHPEAEKTFKLALPEKELTPTTSTTIKEVK
ncbi:hypothetical protein ACFL31_01680, partial [Candidatus Margulisiibacteriota bacterium]